MKRMKIAEKLSNAEESASVFSYIILCVLMNICLVVIAGAIVIPIEKYFTVN